jgi:hypothetical protein
MLGLGGRSGSDAGIEAAEAAARERLREAEAAGRRRAEQGEREAAVIDERAEELGKLTDALVEGVREANVSVISLLDALDEAISRIQASGLLPSAHTVAPPPSRWEPEPELPEPQLEAQAPDAPQPPAEPRRARAGGPSDGARLLATQMAVSGSGREEIVERLRDDFGISDAPEIVDGILGAG